MINIQGNDQDAVILQTPTAAELNSVAEVPESDGSSRSVGKVVASSDALTKNRVKLSKFKKLRVEHQGFIENAIDIKGEATYERRTVTLDDGTTVEALAYVAPETRKISDPYAKTSDDKKITEFGTFSRISGYQYEKDGVKAGYFESIKYDGNSISVSAEGALIQPVAALAADEELAQQIDTTYRKGQNLFAPITPDNYLSRPGMEVETSETFLGKEEINQITPVASEEELRESFADEEVKVIRLSDSLNLEGPQIEVTEGRELTLDLNGNTLTSEGATNQAMFNVRRGGTLIITDSSNSALVDGTNTDQNTLYSNIILTKKDDGNEGEACKVVIEGGKFKGNYYNISGNGTRQNTDVEINGGEFETVTPESVSVYQPQNGKLVINGGKFKADTAIYVKCGQVVINGGEFIGAGPAVEFNHNNNGANPTGDAFVVEACDYPGGTATVEINGGTFTSVNAKPVASYAQTGHEAQRVIKFIKGGTFDKQLDADLIADGYEQVLVDGKYVVRQA